MQKERLDLNYISELKKEMILVRHERNKLDREYEKKKQELIKRETEIHKAYVEISLNGNYTEAVEYFEKLYSDK